MSEITTTVVSPAEAFMAEVITKDPSELINCEDSFEPGSEVHGAVYEQVSRFKQATEVGCKNGHMTEAQALMFTCRFIRSMRQLVVAQNNKEARGLDAHVRAGQGTVLFIRQDGKWFTKLNRSNNILCVGAYLAACSRKTSAWAFLLFTEEGDVHAS